MKSLSGTAQEFFDDNYVLTNIVWWMPDNLQNWLSSKLEADCETDNKTASL